MTIVLARRRRQRDDHAEIQRRLDKQEEDLRKMAERVRIIELEVGIYKPNPLREVNGP